MTPWLELIWYIRRVRRKLFWWSYDRKKAKAGLVLKQKMREDRQKFLARQAHNGKIQIYRGNLSRAKNKTR